MRDRPGQKNRVRHNLARSASDGVIFLETKNQCCGAGAAWSRHFKGGAGANFFIGRSREPERLRLHLFGKQKRKALLL